MTIVTAADLKAHLGIDDRIDDTTINNAVNSINSYIVNYCGREFTDAGSATARVFAPDCQLELTVDDFSTTTGLVVKTDDNDDGVYETTWTLDTDFYLEPLNGKRYGQTWPYYELHSLGTRVFPIWNRRRASVQVTAQWGWAAIPAPVFEAALLIGARIFKRKNSPEGVLGGFDFNPVRISMREDPDAVRLLTDYRDPRLTALVG